MHERFKALVDTRPTVHPHIVETADPYFEVVKPCSDEGSVGKVDPVVHS